MPESPFKRLRPAGLQSSDDFRLHAKRQAAVILEAAAQQERARARLMNLVVARQAILLAVSAVLALAALIGAIGQPDLLSIGLWR